MRPWSRRILALGAALVIIVLAALITVGGSLAAPGKGKAGPPAVATPGGQAFGRVTAYQPGRSITIDPQSKGQAPRTFQVDAQTIVEQRDGDHHPATLRNGDTVTLRALPMFGGKVYVARVIQIETVKDPRDELPEHEATPRATPSGAPATTAVPSRTTPASPGPTTPTIAPTSVPATAAPTKVPTGMPTTGAPTTAPTGVPPTVAPGTITPRATPSKGATRTAGQAP